MTFSGYHQQLLSACQRVEGASLRDTGSWRIEWLVPLKQQAQLRQVLASIPVSGMLQGLGEGEPDLVRCLLGGLQVRRGLG